MIYTQITHLPIIFKVEEGASLRIPQHLAHNKLSFNKIAVFCGASFSRGIAEKISALGGYRLHVVKRNSLAEVDELRQIATRERYDLFIAVGGGKVLDTIKRLAYLTRINHLSVPTIISNDGLISPVSVIIDDTGRPQSMAGQGPMGAIIDLEIIKKSPMEYLRAAAGDILSNISATNDWLLAAEKNGEPLYDVAFQLSRMAANSLVYAGRPELDYNPFIRQIVQAQVNSGVAMSISGTSRPSSGSEHLISHALDYMGLSKHLHGLQVGSLGLFALFLQSALKNEHLSYAKALQIPFILPTIAALPSDKLVGLFSCARTMRVGRYTILDSFTDHQLEQRFKHFRAAFSNS